MDQYFRPFRPARFGGDRQYHCHGSVSLCGQLFTISGNSHFHPAAINASTCGIQLARDLSLASCANCSIGTPLIVTPSQLIRPSRARKTHPATPHVSSPASSATTQAADTSTYADDIQPSTRHDSRTYHANRRTKTISLIFLNHRPIASTQTAG